MCGHFLGNFRGKLCNFLFTHLVTLGECESIIDEGRGAESLCQIRERESFGKIEREREGVWEIERDIEEYKKCGKLCKRKKSLCSKVSKILPSYLKKKTIKRNRFSRRALREENVSDNLTKFEATFFVGSTTTNERMNALPD